MNNEESKNWELDWGSDNNPLKPLSIKGSMLCKSTNKITSPNEFKNIVYYLIRKRKAHDDIAGELSKINESRYVPTTSTGKKINKIGDKFTFDELEAMIKEVDIEVNEKYHLFFKVESKLKENDKVDEISVWMHTPRYQQAMDVLKTEPLYYILDKFNKIHKGDTGLGEILLISSLSTGILNTAGIHPAGNGLTGKGKSDAYKAMFHLLPEGDINNFNAYKIICSSSAKGVLYAGLNDGVVVFLDDVESIPQDLVDIIKRSTSAYQDGYTHLLTDLKKEGKEKVEKIQFPRRITWWITSPNSDFDMQMLNRAIMMNVDESSSQDNDVFDLQTELGISGNTAFEIDDEVLICREMFKILKNENVKVKIPYLDKLQWNNKDNRRNWPMFQDIIRSIASLYRFQRERDEEGYIIANWQDYKKASVLWNVSCAKEQMSKLTKTKMKILDIIYKNVNNGGIFSNGITAGSIYKQCCLQEYCRILFVPRF